MQEFYDTIGKYSKRVSNPGNKIVITEERFCFDQPIVFKLNERFFTFSGDDFTIKDLNGVRYFYCEGKALSIRDRKILLDTYNQPILNILDKYVSLRGKMTIYEGKTQEKALLKVKPKSPIFNKKFTINFFNKATGKDEFFEMHCDFVGFKCKIFYGKKKEGAPMIAQIVLNINTKVMLTSEECYYLEVAPGVDAAALVALAICFDETKNEGSGSFLTEMVEFIL